jgi:hypothetical protein
MKPDTERLVRQLRELYQEAMEDEFDPRAMAHWVTACHQSMPSLLDALDAAETRAAKAEAERDALLEEASVLAAGQCLFPDGTGLTGDEYGNQICAMKARAEAAEDEKHEALNQLDSERHSVAVLEKRVAEKMDALAASEAKVAELRAERDRLWWLVEGFARAVDTGRNEPLQVWRDQARTAIEHRAALRAKAGD